MSLSKQTMAIAMDALTFLRDTLREHSNASIEGGESVLTGEFVRIDAALAELEAQGVAAGEVWEPIKDSNGLTDYLEQGAMVWVTNDGTTMAVYVNGVGGAINHPENIRLCRLTPSVVEQPASLRREE